MDESLCRFVFTIQSIVGMNILFTFLSLPHLTEAGLFNDLIKEFHKQGHNVKVASFIS